MGRTVREWLADGPRGHGVQSEIANQTSNLHPPKFRRSASSLRIVRSSRTVRPHLADGPANKIQPIPTDQMD
jgi:hypothetical protein